MPVVEDARVAARWPDLGVLSALVYGESEQGAAIAAAVLPVIRYLDDRKACFYFDLVYSSLSEEARRDRRRR